MFRRRVLLPLLVAASLGVGCGGAGPGQVVFSVGGGFISGIVYLDADGSGTPGGPDAVLAGVPVRLLVGGSIDTVARATSDANGEFVFGAQPTGRYRIAVPQTAIFGDSLQVAQINAADVTLGYGDTTAVQIAVSFPEYTVADARQRPIGEKFFVVGNALNSRATFGDTTVHLRDATGAIRIVGASGYLMAAGDSIRVLGRASARDGQTVIDGGLAWLVLIGGALSPVPLTTDQAATADSSRLDADLVQVRNATVGDSATVNGDYVLTIDDSSGPVRVVFDQHASLTRSPYFPGVVIDATGVLVPDGAGQWSIKPRSNQDVVLK